MGKSAVLKDSGNRPAGYMRLQDDCVICCAQLQEPSQLALVYVDGSQSEHALFGRDEQRFCCEGKRMRGCYVFRGDELLLVSDEAMRSVFERQICRKSIPMRQEKEQIVLEEKPVRMTGENRFAQRRWPPPPCLQAPRYRNGCWQED